MRLLVGVTHYYRPGDGRHGSLGADRSPRVKALSQLILQLHRLFGGPCATLNHLQRCVQPVSDGSSNLTVHVCVSQGDHILGDLDHLSALFQKIDCTPNNPRLLGFSCQRHLLDLWAQALAAGNPYDYICYLEDDIVLNDPDFFLKLSRFNQAFGNDYLLMPNRIETMESSGQLARFYIDGDYNPSATEQYRTSGNLRFCLEHLGQVIRFDQPFNLHSGCFFLNATQASTYFRSNHACSEDSSFHGPLESAATLGMLQTFQLVKPALCNGRFLTVEHVGRNFMSLVPSLI